MKKIGILLTIAFFAVLTPVFAAQKTSAKPNANALGNIKPVALSAASSAANAEKTTLSNTNRLNLQNISRMYFCGFRSSVIASMLQEAFGSQIGATVNYNMLVAYFRDKDKDCYYDYYGPVVVGGNINMQNILGAAGDCNDNDKTINPGKTEVWYDGIDSNCDARNDYDQDMDGYTDQTANSMALVTPLSNAKYAIKPTSFDCNDTNASIYPGAVEYDDELDNDCDGTVDEDVVPFPIYYLDADSDTYGNPAVSVNNTAIAPAGYVANNTDCNDSDNTMYPGNTEVCDNKDNNCDGTIDENPTNGFVWYRDSDGDTYGNPALTINACTASSGYVSDNTDCNDSNATMHPNATDAWYDGIDSNCDGANDYDQDSDGYNASAYNGNDCNDTNNTVYPLAPETWYDGIDSDCAGNSDYDQDVDGYDYDTAPEADNNGTLYPRDGYDCDDTNSTIGQGEFFECGAMFYSIPYPYSPYAEGYLCAGECFELPYTSLYCNFKGRVYSQSSLCTYLGGGQFTCEICNN